MDLNIREATRADLPALLDLYHELDGGETLSLTKAEQLFARIRSYPDYRLYVATIEQSIVGTFALLIMDKLAHGGAPSGIVEDVVVHSDWQGKGIGAEMMRFAMEQCSKAGCYKLALSSDLKREAAHRFYENLGFQKHGFSFVVGLRPGGLVARGK